MSVLTHAGRSHGSLIQNLRETNARFGSLVASLHPDSAQTAKPVTPEQIAALMSELMRTGAWLLRLPEEKDSALEAELRQYREIVERLRIYLPSVQSALLEEKSRLERERARLAGTAEWVGRSRQTL